MLGDSENSDIHQDFRYCRHIKFEKVKGAIHKIRGGKNDQACLDSCESLEKSR